VRAARPRGGVVTLDTADGPEHEAVLAVARLRAARADGVRWGAQAVLVRRFAQAPELELALLRAGVPYALVGAPDALSHPLCRAALAGLHLVAVPDAPVPVRARAWLRWLRALGLPHGHASAFAARLAATGAGDAAALGQVVGRAPADAARVRSATERMRRASEDGAAAALAAAEQALLPWPRHGATAAILRVLRTATAEGILAPRGATASELLASLAQRRRSARGERDRVLLTSAHRSKGLEWDVVVVPGQTLGVFPQRDEAEERRLGYVAWTRARERLHLVRDGGGPASPFLRDADIDGLMALQRDLAWCDAGTGQGSAAAAWARAEAERRFHHEAAGTTDPRGHAPSVLGFGHVERRAHTWHGSRSRTRAARGTRAA
jgi:DNA helicase II / ATP-dependent DNA helicase PcrA